MLAIRLQRTGRKKLAHYRLIAQEHRIQPTSGNVVAYLGSFNPHTKEVSLDQEKIEYYLSNGAQPSNSAAKLMQREGIKLPDWVKITQKPDRKKTPSTDDAAEQEAPAEETPAADEEPQAEEAAQAEPKEEADEKTEKPQAKAKESKEAETASDDTQAK